METDTQTLSSNGRATQAAALSNHGILLFDGICNLCNGFVNFVIDHDPQGYFKFGALQSSEAAPYLRRYGLEGEEEALSSVVLIEDGMAFRQSTAALRVLRRLGPPWALLYGFMVVPRPLRDAVYGWIARNRYAWFGKRDQCRIPTPELQSRFL